MLYKNANLKIIQLPRCSLPTVREFADVLVKADIPGIRLSVSRVYTVTESFIRDISRFQPERVDTILCKKRSYRQFSARQNKCALVRYIYKSYEEQRVFLFLYFLLLDINRDVLLLD